MHSQITDSADWTQGVQPYPYIQPRTVLPLGTMTGIDLRYIYPFASIYGADAGMTLSRAAKPDDGPLYRVSWSGDATSLLVAFQMPTTADGTQWDFRDRGGRITPDLDELEANPDNPPFGEFLEFGWRNTLNANHATDKFGPDDPLTLAGLTENPSCTDFSGNTYYLYQGRSYGDRDPLYINRTADPYGYFRQYDYGSCSAFLPLHTFLRIGLSNAAITQQVPGSTPVGTLNIHTTSARLLVASVLRDQTLQGPELQRQPVLRVPGTDELQADLSADGHIDTTVFGDNVTCPFHATWKVRIRMGADTTRPYYNRIWMDPSDIKGAHIDLGDCGGYGIFNQYLDDLISLLFLDKLNYHTIGQGKANGATGTVRANLLDQLESDVYAANEALTPPIPEQNVLALGAVFGRDALDQELRTHRATSTLLLSRAPGPAGSCISGNLRYLDNSECAFQSDATLRSLLQHPETFTFGRALRRLMRNDPSMFTCAPIRGAWGASGHLASLASQAPYTYPNGQTVSLADRIGACTHEGDVPRLFVSGDTVFQACLNPSSGNSQCRMCAKTQDGGQICNFWSLLDWDRQHPLNVLYSKQCLRPVKAQPGLYYPQVVCRAAASAPGARCVPRFDPGYIVDERSAMCVPVQGIDSACAPCFDMLDPGTSGVEDASDRAACLAAPAFCRVSRGQVNSESCDARDFASLIDRGLIRIPTPYRCRLELPLSRVDLQPDGYRIVLSNGFPCQNGTQTRTGPSTDCRPCPPGGTCPIGSLSQDKLKYLVWDRLTGLLGGDLGLQDIQPPGCYPDREEFGHPARPLTGTSALLGQLKNGQTRINPVGCGWQ